MSGKKTVLGLLGLGNIGGGVWDLLLDFGADLTARSGLELCVKRALVKDRREHRGHDVPDSVLTTDPSEVLDDPEIDIICEFLGGEHPAADWMLQAMRNGKSVVTANKLALARHWPELEAAAKENGVGLYYEASVGGAIPIISTLQEALQSSRVSQLMAIINGTTNYILSRMTANGEDYASVLEDAQRLGLAEPDPSNDVEGMDAVYKLSVMASLAFHTRVPFDRIYREGITGITAFDIACGKELGYTLKLLAIGKRTGKNVEVRVHPTFLPADHPLALVNGSFNAVYLKGHACREMMLQGRGAGDAPTASAIVADILRAAKRQEHFRADFANLEEPDPSICFTDNWETRFYVRLSAEDRPGVLSEISGCFAREGVSIHSMIQKSGDGSGRVPVIFITHEAPEQAMRAAVSALDPSVSRLESLIRVES